MNTQLLGKLPQSITIPRWFDRHLHLRDNDMLERVLPCTVNQRATGAVIMGNLLGGDHTYSIEKTAAYRERIMEALLPGSDFKPCMTCYLTDQITPEEIEGGFKRGVWNAAKLYMADKNGEGGTTGSAHGVRDLEGRYRVLERMEEIGMPLLGHFEVSEKETDEFDREVRSMERDLQPIVTSFPGLKIVVEHITDGRMADFVAGSDHPIYATVTPHHMMMNRGELFWGGLNSVHWCKPVLKREEHRLRVRRYVTSGHPRFGAGTDSAPHDVEKKSLPCGCNAGIFTAPVAVELYATIFDEDDAIRHLSPFLSENFLDLYGVPVSSETMTIVREPTVIPECVGPVLVFKGGKTLPWKLVS